MNLIALMEQALNEITNKKTGERFILSKLFDETLWNQIDLTIRMHLGRRFNSEMKSSRRLSII